MNAVSVGAMIVDGRSVPVRGDQSVLDAARLAGIEVSTLCHHPALPPDGSCRLCAVEIEGRPGVQTACTFPASDGLRVRTKSPPTEAARRNALALLLRRYRPRPGTLDNELLALARAHGLSPDGSGGGPRR